MKLNYIMLPENFVRRPRPGHRHLVKKVTETFSPLSRAGRRAPGEAKETVSMAGNAKEEVRAKEFTKFVKTLNRKVAGQRRPTRPARKAAEVESVLKSRKTSNGFAPRAAPNAVVVDAASGLSGQREASRSGNGLCCPARVIRMNSATPSMVRVEDMPRPDSPVSRDEAVTNAVDARDTNQDQTVAGPADTVPMNNGIGYHHLPVADTVQHADQSQFVQQPLHDVVPPALPHVVTAHQDVVFPGPEIHNYPIQPFLLNTAPALGYAFIGNGPMVNNEEAELERTAIACAYMGMDEPMDISPDFPSLMADNDYRDLERTAIGCAYAAMNEPMDTDLDDTQGPMAHTLPQDVPPVIGFIRNAQQPGFDHGGTFQQPVYETLRPPGNQQFIDQDHGVWPFVDAPMGNDIQPQLLEGNFVHYHFPLPVHHYNQAGDYPHGEDHLGLLPDFGRNALPPPGFQPVFHEQNNPHMVPIQAIDPQDIGHGFHFYPGPQQEPIQERLLQEPVNGLAPEHELGANWNAGRTWQHEEDGRDNHPGFFVDLFGANEGQHEELRAHILDRIEALIRDIGQQGREDDYDDSDNDTDNEYPATNGREDDDYDDDDDDDDSDEENEFHIII